MKINEQIVFQWLLFAYTLSLILFSEQPAFSFLSLAIGALLVVAYAVEMLYHQEKSIFLNRFLLVYMVFYIWCLASILWATDEALSMKMVVRMTFLTVTLIVIYNVLKRYDIKNAFYYALITGTFINFVLFFNLFSVPFDTWLWLRYQGTLNNPNVLSIVSILSIVASAILLNINRNGPLLKTVLISNIAVSIFLIFQTASKKGLLFGSVFMIFLMFYSKIKMKTLGISLLLASVLGVIIVKFTDTEKLLFKVDYIVKRMMQLFDAMSGRKYDLSSNERMQFIVEGFDKFADTPIFGHGIDNFRVYFGLYAHNNFIELLFDVGLVGLIMYYSVHVSLLMQSRRVTHAFLRNISIILIVIIMMMDVAVVSYFTKYLFTFLVVYSFTLENYSKVVTYEKI